MSHPLRVGVVGAGGRVGVELLNLIKQTPGLTARVGVGNHAQGFEMNVATLNDVDPQAVDIIVDFSAPKLFELALSFCVAHNLPFVSGTTGLDDSHRGLLKKAGERIPTLWAPNMSLGIAVLKSALKVLRATRHFDFQVEEWHHRHKKDRPSGTALLLQNELEQVIGRECPPPLVMRAGGIFGVHKVYAVSDEEIIQFEHTAINRTVFARGALVAAQWLHNKPKGLYTLDDIIA